MQDINKSRVELRDRQTQTREYISRFELLALRSHLHLKGFSLSPQKKQSSAQKEGTKANDPLHKRKALSQCTKHIQLYTRGKHKANEGNNTW